MTEHKWCPVCNGHILTIKEEAKGICSYCESKQHAKDFHDKFDIKEDGNVGMDNPKRRTDSTDNNCG